MSHLAIQRSRRRYIGPDARKDGTTVKARLKAGEDCEEWDLLLTDIPAVVASGVEVHSRNADFATPMFTEVTPRYIINGVYAGVSMNSTEMFGQIQSHTPSYRSITKHATHRPVPKLVSSLYHGVVTQFNFSDKHWRHGQPLLMGPEYMPEDKKQPPRVTWYPVQSDDLFHSSIAALLATAFGKWYGEWGAMFFVCGEHLPADVDNNDKTKPLGIAAADSVALAKFLKQQRLFGWTRLSYVAAKVIGSTWDETQLRDWITEFYEAEMAYERSDERRDETSAVLLGEECADLLAKFGSLDIGFDLVKKDQRAQPYVSTVLANATAIDMAGFSSCLENLVPGNKKSKEDEEMINELRQDPVNVFATRFLSFGTVAKKSMMGIYKLFIVNHLRGLSLATVAPNSYGLVQIM